MELIFYIEVDQVLTSNLLVLHISIVSVYRYNMPEQKRQFTVIIFTNIAGLKSFNIKWTD